VGNKISQTDPNGHITTWAYDNLGRVVKHTLSLGMYETFTYDPNGNMLTKTDFNGDTTTYAYYACCNRLLTTTYDTTQVTYTYTPTGRRETVTDARGVTTYTYDQRDRLLTVQNPDGSILSYTYDLKNRTSVTIPSGTTTYTYDTLNRLSTVTDPDGGLTTYTYDNVGNRKTVISSNSTVAEYNYDTLNRLTYLKNRKSTGDIISSYTYTLGPAGNCTRVVEHTGRIVDYVYDNLYRLTQEQITDPVLGNETISYTYDAFGNRLTKTDSNGTITYAYDANDRLLSETAPSYTNTYNYDNNGNTLSKSDGTNTTSYVYDYENRLISVQTPSSQLGYTYDADGIRVSSTVDATITNYLVDKNRDYAQVLEERDSAGSLIVSYVYGDDLISQHRGGADSYYHYDAQMSTRQLTNETEDVVNTYVYDAFGITLDQAGVVANNYLYSGEQYDANVGFYYLRARYYDNNIGRFVTTDPFEGKPFEPVTLHKYLYANCNPVMFRDPSGEFTASVGSLMAGISIRGVLAATVISTATALIALEPPMRLYRYTSNYKVEEAKRTGYVIGKYGVTWWTDVFYATAKDAKNYLDLKYLPEAWLSVLIYRIRDLLFGPTTVKGGLFPGNEGGANEYWTFKTIPFWSRSPAWGLLF
jgi:RHS repeat-associated protein